MLNKAWIVKEHKSLEIQLFDLWWQQLFLLRFNGNTGGDHPGWDFDLVFLFLHFGVYYSDTRHQENIPGGKDWSPWFNWEFPLFFKWWKLNDHKYFKVTFDFCGWNHLALLEGWIHPYKWERYAEPHLGIDLLFLGLAFDVLDRRNYESEKAFKEELEYELD